MEGFGKAKFGSGKRNWWKLKDGTNGPYRIIGPIGDLQEEGRWSVYSKIHYGYKNSSGEMRTFESPELRNRKTKMIEVPDAALNRITQLKAKLDEAKKAGNVELTEQLLKLVGGKKSRYNLDSNHYMNVIDLQGNIGILKIRHRAMLALQAVIKDLRSKDVEPLDPESGRFFNFHRSGMGQETVYQVSVYKKKFSLPEVGEVEQDVVHTITTDIAKRCIAFKDGKFQYKEAARLDTLFKKPTAEEVERIVRDGEKAVDEILDAKTKAATEFSNEDDSGLEGEDDSHAQATTPVAATATTPMTHATAAFQQQSPMGMGSTGTQTPSATLKTNPYDNGFGSTGTQQPMALATPTPAPVTSTSGAPKTTAQVLADQTEKEFLKSLGLDGF